MNTQLTKPNKIQPPNPCGSDSARIAQMARACAVGEIQSHGPISVIPIVEEGLSEGPDYLSLGEAMDKAAESTLKAVRRKARGLRSKLAEEGLRRRRAAEGRRERRQGVRAGQ